MSNKKPEYEVGYKKPPVATRFKAGQSGNRKGRPRGSKNFDTVFTQELNAPVEIIENGERRRISKRDAIVKQVVNKAASGDHKCISTVLSVSNNIEEKHKEMAVESAGFSAEDDLVMASVLSRLKRLAAEEEGDET